nr:hypothetical protein GCM10020092_054520 [Actinoplanes digitatis]
MAFSPDGRVLALGSPSRSLRLCDTTTGAELCSLTGRRMGVVSAAFFSPDGTEVLTVAGRARHRLPPGSFDRSFGRWRIREIDVEPSGVVAVPADDRRVLRHPSHVHSMAFSPDGGRLVTNDGTVRVWRLDGDGDAAGVGNANVVADVVWSPDGAVFAFTRGLTTVVLVDPETGREVRNWDCGMIGVSSLAFSADGGKLAAALGDHSIVIWDPSTGRTLQRLTGPRSTTSAGRSAMTFSPDGTRLAKGAEDGTYAVHLWHLGTGRLRQLHGHTDYVVAVAFDPSGARLASGGLDRSVVLWDAATGDELGELTGHTGALRAVAFSPDGTRLATADSAGTVDLRDPVTGSPTHRLTHDGGPVTSIAFSPDGAGLATARSDTTVRLWTLLGVRSADQYSFLMTK